MVEFISYDGKYPNLCSGNLVLRIDGEEVTLQGCLISGGCVSFTSDWDEVVTSGEWDVDVPKAYLAYEDEIIRVVNENVRQGCCGGCV